jgi:hypothetical protein
METSIHPDAVSRQLEQSRTIHASNLNSSAGADLVAGGAALQDDWKAFFDVDSGNSNLQRPPAQIAAAAGGWGSRSREGGLAAQNEYGFDSHHFHRRYAAGSIPGNYMWMRPGSRPMIKSMPSSARPPVGSNSPFAGQDLGASFGYAGAVLMDPATEYVAPPTPYVAPATQATPSDAAPEIAWY